MFLKPGNKNVNEVRVMAPTGHLVENKDLLGWRCERVLQRAWKSGGTSALG